MLISNTARKNLMYNIIFKIMIPKSFSYEKLFFMSEQYTKGLQNVLARSIYIHSMNFIGN